MGYQVAITPLQMVAAVSSVANGGQYIEPRVLRAVYRNGVRYQVTPKVLRQTVSADTAAALGMTQLMPQAQGPCIAIDGGATDTFRSQQCQSTPDLIRAVLGVETLD